MGTMNAATLPVVEDAGRRLERYVRMRWPQDQGGIRGLARSAGVSADAIYKAFRGDVEPELTTMGAIAKALGITRSQLLAIYDGEAAPPDIRELMDPELRRQLVELIAEVVERRLPDE